MAIIALLVGGVMGAQTMIHSSELRSVITQYQEFVTATNSFKLKYGYLPGDIPNATRYWGLADASGGTTVACRNTASTDARTCDGDADGRVRMINASDPGPEPMRFWQHLANAELIHGNRYTGTYDASGSTTVNSPSGKLNGGLWLAYSYDTHSGGPVFFDGIYGNSLTYGGYYAGDAPKTAIMLTQDLWDMDAKIDDGKPAMGMMTVITYVGFTSCTTAVDNGAAGAADLNADYLPTATTPTCELVLRGLF